MFYYNNAIKSAIEHSENAGYSLLSKGEEYELIEKAQNGCYESANKLFFSNIKLVASCMKGIKAFNMTKEDIFHEGVFGLYDAIERFDTSKDCRFSTYATLVIKHRMVRAISNNDRTVRLPVYVIDNLNKILKAKSEFEEEGNYDPSIEELSKRTGIDEKNITRALMNKDRMMSTDIEFEGKDGSVLTFEELYCPDSMKVEDLHEEVSKKMLKKDLSSFLEDKLNQKHFEIVRDLYGLNEDGKEYEYNDLAEKHSLSVERIRQIEKSAISKLKNYKDELELMFC